MLAILFGQILGLVRGIIVAQTFGAGRELDAFLAANRVSETLFLLVAGGALGSAFIPAFTRLLATQQKDEAWRLASSVGTLLALVLVILSIAAAALAPHLVRYALAPGFSEDAELFALTVSLLRIQLISVVLFGVGGLVVGILNAHQVFLVPALSPAMYQMGIIIGAVALSPSMGIHGLAWGVVIGAGLYLLLQLPSLFSQRGRFEARLGLGDQSVRQVIVLMGPRLLGVAVVQLNFWVNTWLASQMPEGSVTGVYYGFSLMLMAQTVLAQSVAIAAMPTFSAQHALGRTDELRSSLVASLRGVVLLSVPASLGLIMLRQPLVSLLYARGEFGQRSVELVTWALLWYAVGLVGHSVMELLTRAFFAQQDTRTPVLIGTGAMLLNVVLSVLLSRVFAMQGMSPHGGLALANSAATALEATALFAVMRARLSGLSGQRVGQALGAAVVGGGFMSLVLSGWMRWSAQSNLANIVLPGVALGVLTYGLAMFLLRVPEVAFVGSLTANMRSRLARRFNAQK